MLPWRLGLVFASHSLDERHSISLSLGGLWTIEAGADVVLGSVMAAVRQVAAG